MPWTRKLPIPIELKDGQELVTLADARALFQTLPRHRQRSEEWLYAIALMQEMAVTGQTVTRETIARLKRALTTEGLL
jgi:hypothetical protein